jgi:tetratricopeptide (TPR) repeat protein
MLEITQGRRAAAERELDAGFAWHAQLQPGDAIAAGLLAENLVYLLESQLLLRTRATGPDPAAVRETCSMLLASDPYNLDSLLAVGDAYALLGDLETAAGHFARAGWLETSAGAVGWFRAGQCHDALGDRTRAVEAMGMCLELDATAVEPREYLRAARAS